MLSFRYSEKVTKSFIELHLPLVIILPNLSDFQKDTNNFGILIEIQNHVTMQKVVEHFQSAS